MGSRRVDRRVARGLLGLAALGWTLVATEAHADYLSGALTDQLTERSHRVQAWLDRGHARLVVRRAIYNSGPGFDEATIGIELPGGAVATGLRSHGSAGWRSAELLPAAGAQQRYYAEAAEGEWVAPARQRPAGRVLLSWQTQTRLQLEVFPCPGRSVSTVEYSLTMPTSYAAGRHGISLPALGTEHHLARVSVHAARGADRLWVGGRVVPAGSTVALSRDQETRVELAPHRAKQLAGALASVTFGPSRELVHYRVHARPKLTRAPRGAYVAVLIDGSRSLGADEHEAALAAARAYLSHLPDALVQVLVFDRQVRRPYPSFTPVRHVLADLARARITPRNGSHLDRALDEAASLLATAPARAASARRIVVLTDTLTRSSLSQSRLAATAARTGAVVHVGEIRVGDPALTRDDTHAWAPLLRPTGGVMWTAHMSAEAADHDAMRQAYEELARPLRLHHLKVTAGGLSPDDIAAPTELAEGEGLEQALFATQTVAKLSVAGELWTQSLQSDWTPSDAEGHRWSALAMGTPMLRALSAAETRSLARRGGAVSPQTSYLVVQPGAPAPPRSLHGTSGLSLSGSTSCGGGRGFGRIGPAVLDRQAFLERELGRLWRRCGGAPTPATVKLETTYAEVVDVPSVTVHQPTTPALESCLHDAAWALDLPPAFTGQRDDWSVDL